MGAPLSLGATGLISHAPAELLASALSALVVVGYFAWAADFARVVTTAAAGRARLVAATTVVATGAVFALVAGALLPAAELIRLHATELVLREPFAALASNTSAAILAWCLPLLGLATLVAGSERKKRLRSTVAIALILGSLAVLVSLAVRLQVDFEGVDDRLWRYSLTLAWVAVGAAILAVCWSSAGTGVGRLTGGFAASGLTALIAWTGYVSSEDLWFDHTGPARDVLTFCSDVVGVAAIVGAFPAGLVWLARDRLRVREHVNAFRVAASAIALAVVAAGVVTQVPPLIMDAPVTRVGPSPSDRGLQEYLDQQVTPLLRLQEQAAADFQSAMPLPPGEAAARIRDVVLPQYDQMLATINQQDVRQPEAVRVQRALRTWLAAERTSDLAVADALDGQGSSDDHPNALAEADRAFLQWLSVYNDASQQAEGGE